MKRSLQVMLITAVLAAPTLSVADPVPMSSDWDVSLGLATITLPSYLGDNKNRSLIAPDISVSYKDRFFASTLGGLGYNVINQNGWRAGPIVKYHAGRQENGDESYFVDDGTTNDLQGLGDIEGTAEIGGFVEYTKNFFQTSLEIRQGIDGHEGALGDVSIQYLGQQLIAGKSVAYAIGPQAVLGDSDYLSAFFSVDEQQSAASGLSIYEADGGILSYGLRGSVVVPVTDRVSVVGFGSVNRLADEVADSSLVSTRGSDDQASAGIVLNVSF